MKTWSAIACALLLLLVGANPSTHPSIITVGDIGENVVILGDLGIPVGQATTISGHKASIIGPLQDVFIVETIDGKGVPEALQIEVEGSDAWPKGTQATLDGYEVGTLRFPQAGNLGRMTSG